MPKITAHTITDYGVLEQEFARIRQQGYAVDREETVEGACCIGVPIRDSSGAVVASISASMVTEHFYHWNERQLASVMKLMGAELSAAIGYGASARTMYKESLSRLQAGR